MRNESGEIALLRPDVAPQLADAIAGCLVKDVAQRFASADAVRRALEGTSGSPAPPQPPNQPARYRRLALGLGAAGLLATAAYALGIRRDAPDPAASRVVVAPFENRTGQPSLDPIGTMTADWVIQGLSRTGVIEVVPITTSLAAARYVQANAGATDTADHVQRIAKEAGAWIVVSGAYYQQADSVYLRATVTDAHLNRVVNALDPIGAPSTRPLAAIELLRQRLMSILALRLNPRVRNSPAVLAMSPPTFDAYQASAEGFELFFERDWRGAIARFAEASARDSSYTIPLVMSAMAYLNLGNFAAVDSVVSIARPRVARMSEGERIAFETAVETAKGDFAAAYAAQVRIQHVVPAGIAHWGFGSSALDINRPREAIRVFRQLDPDRGELRGWLFYWRDLARAHHRLGEFSAELRAARRASELYPDIPQPRGFELPALAAMGRVDEVQALIQAQAQRGAPLAPLQRQVALELLAHGFSAEGAAMLRASLDRARTLSLNDLAGRLFRAEASALVGERDEAERLLRTVLAEAPDRFPAQGLLGTLAARRGDSTEAMRVSNWFATLKRPYLRGTNTYWRARIAAQLGDKDGAVRLLRQAFAEGYLIWGPAHTEPDFASLRDYPPFRALLLPKG